MLRPKLIEVLVLLVIASLAIVDGVAIASHRDQMRALEAGGYEILLGVLLIAATIAYAMRERAATWTRGKGARWAVGAFGILATYALLIPLLGYVLSTLLTFLAYLRFFSPYRWAPIIAYSLVVSVGSAGLWESLAISLPDGLLPWP